LHGSLQIYIVFFKGLNQVTHTDNTFSIVQRASQVELRITNNSFCVVQRAIAQPKTGIFRDYGVAKAPPGFQAG
jgi:hypothetical protein